MGVVELIFPHYELKQKDVFDLRGLHKAKDAPASDMHHPIIILKKWM